MPFRAFRCKKVPMIPLSLYFISNLSNPLPLACFLLFTYMGMHTIKTNDMTRQNRALDLSFNKGIQYIYQNRFCATEFCCQRSIQNHPNHVESKKSKWKVSKWNIILYCHFVLIIFIFSIHQNLRPHATMLLTRNWKKRKKAPVIKTTPPNHTTTSTARLIMVTVKLFA